MQRGSPRFLLDALTRSTWTSFDPRPLGEFLASEECSRENAWEPDAPEQEVESGSLAERGRSDDVARGELEMHGRAHRGGCGVVRIRVGGV